MSQQWRKVSGFAASGIFPYKPEKFSDVDFICENTIQQPVIIDHENVDEPPNMESIQNINLSAAKHPETTNESATETRQHSGHQKVVRKKTACLNLTGIYAYPEAGSSKQDTVLKAVPKPSQSPTCFKETLEYFSPLLSLSTDNKDDRNNRKQHSIIMTGTPMKAVLEDAKKKNKKIKDVKAKLRLEKPMDNPKVIPKVKLKLLKKRSSNVGKIVKTKMNTHSKNKSAAKRRTTKKRCRRQISFEE